MEEKSLPTLPVAFRPDERLLVALSGGADSVALLRLAAEAKAAGAAAHCNFRLRGEESDRDERFVRTLCQRLGVRLFVRRFDTAAQAAASGESIEMAARRLRYGWFRTLCKQERLTGVAVAHHRDDNAETFLLNLLRGTGLKGLTGMRRDRTENGLRIVRPLLDLPKRDILDYLEALGQDYVADSTNADPHYRRNLIRHEILPLLHTINPRIGQTLHETAQRLAEAELLCRYGSDRLREEAVKGNALEEGMEIDCGALHRMPAAAALLHEWLSPYGFTATQTGEAFEMRTGGITESGQWLLTRTPAKLLLHRRPEPIAPIALPMQGGKAELPDGRTLTIESLKAESLTEIPKGRETAVLDADCLEGPLCLRSVREGDRFTPFGMKGSRLVSDYLTDHHRSRVDKLAALVVADRAGIVWLVGERPDERLRVTVQTRRILLLKIN